MAVENSILDTTKKLLMIGPEDDSFDIDIVIAINTAFVGLHTLGVGPSPAFEIEDNSKTWSDFLGSMTSAASVKSYVYLRAKQLFDLAATSYTIQAREKQIEKLEWILQAEHDRTPAAVDALNLEAPPEPFQLFFTGNSNSP